MGEGEGAFEGNAHPVPCDLPDVLLAATTCRAVIGSDRQFVEIFGLLPVS